MPSRSKWMRSTSAATRPSLSWTESPSSPSYTMRFPSPMRSLSPTRTPTLERIPPPSRTSHDTTPTRTYPTNLTAETVFFLDDGVFPSGALEEFAGSFEGTCPVEGDTGGNGIGAAAGGNADGAMLVLNGFPSFLCGTLIYMSIFLGKKSHEVVEFLRVYCMKDGFVFKH